MLAPGMRVEGCARCAHGTTGKRTSLLQFLENPEESCQPLPSFSFTLPDSMLGHASRYRRPFHCRRLLLRKSSVPSLFLHLRCDVPPRIPATVASMCRSRHSLVDDLHNERRPGGSVHSVETGVWYIVEESIDFVGAVCVGALKAEVSPGRWQCDPISTPIPDGHPSKLCSSRKVMPTDLRTRVLSRQQQVGFSRPSGVILSFVISLRARTPRNAFLWDHCDNFHNLLLDLRHWHVPNLFNGALLHTILQTHLSGLHNWFLDPLHKDQMRTHRASKKLEP